MRIASMVMLLCLAVTSLSTVSRALDIIIDEFGDPEIADWAINARVWRDGKGQPIDEKPFSLTHVDDPGILGRSPGGLRVEFASAKAKKTPNCYGLLRRINVPHPAPETDCLMFNLSMEAGGGVIKSVDLFHVPTWRKFTAGSIRLDFDGRRRIVLKREDMTAPGDEMEWADINYIQLVVFGDFVATISDLRWADSTRLSPSEPPAGGVVRAELPVQDVTAEQVRRGGGRTGVRVFSRNRLERCTYNTVPRPREMFAGLTVFGSPGEYEPATFSVRSASDLPGVNVALGGDLRSDDGTSSISASAVEFRVVTPMSLWLDTRRMREVEYLLMKEPRVKIAANRTKRFWVTVHIPEEASAGTYGSSIELRQNGTVLERISYRVEVLPIKLAELDDIAYFMYFRTERLPGWGQNRAYFTRCLEDMREHGINSITAYVYPDGSPAMETAKPGTLSMADHVGAIKDSGLLRPGAGKFIWIAAACYGSWGVKAFTPLVRENGWEMLAYAIDEPGDERRQKLVRKVVPRLKKACPDVDVTTAIGDKGIEVVGEYYDTWICATGHTDDARVAQARERGKRLWTYECALSPTDALTCRHYFGYWLWRSGATGAAFWAYCDGSAKDRFMLPVKDWTTHDPRWITRHDFVWCVPEGPIPSVGWEAAREGIDDFRYLRTLEQTIAEVGKTGGPEVKAAKLFLEDLHRRIKPGNYGKALEVARDRAKEEGRNTITLFERATPEPALTRDDYSTIRRQAADHILRLQDAMR